MTENVKLQEQFAIICRLLHMAHHHKSRHHGPMADPHRGQGRVLSLLRMQPEISQKDLSYLLDIRPQSLGELLAKLEKSGYITRTQSDSDNRVLNISLTVAGMAATEQMATEELDLFAALSEEEQDTLAELLSRVIAGMEASLGEEMLAHRPAHGQHGPHGHGRHGHDQRPPHPHGEMREMRGECGMGGHERRHGHPHGRDRDCCGPHGRGERGHEKWSEQE